MLSSTVIFPVPIVIVKLSRQYSCVAVTEESEKSVNLHPSPSSHKKMRKVSKTALLLWSLWLLCDWLIFPTQAAQTECYECTGEEACMIPEDKIKTQVTEYDEASERAGCQVTIDTVPNPDDPNAKEVVIRRQGYKFKTAKLGKLIGTDSDGRPSPFCETSQFNTVETCYCFHSRPGFPCNNNAGWACDGERKAKKPRICD